jgi:hypothetical protein
MAAAISLVALGAAGWLGLHSGWPGTFDPVDLDLVNPISVMILGLLGASVWVAVKALRCELRNPALGKAVLEIDPPGASAPGRGVQRSAEDKEAGFGSRAISSGADLFRRAFLRGERARKDRRFPGLERWPYAVAWDGRNQGPALPVRIAALDRARTRSGSHSGGCGQVRPDDCACAGAEAGCVRQRAAGGPLLENGRDGPDARPRLPRQGRGAARATPAQGPLALTSPRRCAQEARD